MDSKRTAFIAMLSALGTVLSVISLQLAPILTAVSGQAGAALDLSHVATFIAAIFGGPVVGAIVGFLSGIYAGYYFGYVIGGLGLVSLIGVPLGKALTGLVAGFLYKALRIPERKKASTLTIPVVLVSYIPESIFTAFYFLYIVTITGGSALAFMLPIVIPKAWIEITIMSLLMGALTGNLGFKIFVTKYIPTGKHSNIQLKKE